MRVIDRRGFLNALAALGLAEATRSSATTVLLQAKAIESATPGSGASQPKLSPGRTKVLKSKSLTVIFDAETGLPFQYRFGEETVWAESAGTPIAAIICRLRPRSYETVPLKVVSAIETAESVVFTFAAYWQQKIAAGLSLRFALGNASVVVTMEDVVEHPGFEFIEAALPNLATVRESDEMAWMAQGRDGGSFVRLSGAKPYRYEDDDNFGRISTQLPMGAVGKGSVGCVMEVTAFMDGTETAISQSGKERRAGIGTVQVYRVHGGRCYNMNDGKDGVCGTVDTPNLLVGQGPRCRLDFYKEEDRATPWLPAAKLLRARMPSRPTQYFDDRFVYMIAGKLKIEPEPRTTFAQSAALIRDMARLTDYAPQVAYISGWVYDGQDTGYPSEDVVNRSLGSYEELMQLMAESRRLNANVSVNVNYDDAYKSSPQFDPAFIAREPDGAIWKSRAWDGEDSYVVGMAKYVRGGWARQRIEATMARYKLRSAMLIDAFSWFAIRNDWDRAHPASGYTNLVDGKWEILDEFRRRGVNVTSEQFRYPMLGKLALSVNGPEPRECPFGGEQVPLTAVIYRKAAVFGDSGDGVFRPQLNLFWNSRPGVWYEHKTDRKAMTDFYYLIVLPYNKVHLLDVETYAAGGTMREIGLERDSKIVMDAAGASYKVVCNGATIAVDESTTCPVDESRIAFYSRAGGRLSYPVPPAWRASEMTARALTIDGRKAFPVRAENGQIVVDCPAQMPVMVYAAASAIASPEGRGDAHGMSGEAAQ
jgi:hypothetical protein